MHVTAAEKVEQLPKTSILCRCKLGLVHQEQLSCFANQSHDWRVKKNERKKTRHLTMLQDIYIKTKTACKRRSHSLFLHRASDRSLKHTVCTSQILASQMSSKTVFGTSPSASVTSDIQSDASVLASSSSVSASSLSSSIS